MVEDWRATLDAVRAEPDVGDGPIGYWGLSMGSIYGIPLVAAEPRIKVAVLGLLGLVGPTKERLATDAAKITCTVLYLRQWDDQLFARDKVIDLYERVGGVDQRLQVLGRRAAQRREVVADDARVDAGRQAHRLQLAQRHLAPAGVPEDHAGQSEPEQRDPADRLEGSDERAVAERRPRPRVEEV